MPLNTVNWTIADDEKLVDLVKPHPELYNLVPSQNSALGQTLAHTWQEISNKISKPAEECKKRWKALRNEYIGNRRLITLVHERRKPLQEKLQFLNAVIVEDQVSQDPEFIDLNDSLGNAMVEGESSKESIAQQVITDNQEYYEIEVVDETSQVQPTPNRPVIKLLPAGAVKTEPAPKKIVKRNVGRKKAVPIPPNLTPVKILPKPLIPMREPRLVRCIETPKTLEQRSQTVDRLIEKVIKENTNEIDVFFRSMAASVKKLQPNLIPKVKMEVCNVIAKYEMQSFDKTT